MPMHIEDFEVGQEMQTAARTVTEADVTAFAGLSGDYNSIHTDAEYARGTAFGERIAHGMLVFSIATGLGVRTGVLDGTVIAFLGIEDWKFLRPVFLGDTIRLRWTVTGARPSSKGGSGVLTRRMEIVNQRGEVVQAGTTVTLVKSRPRVSP
jgi:acyl dehydratase